jgi:regulator of sigma E protease
MIHILISIAGILLTIFFVIGTHESAHFVAARLFGVKVLRFSIGFGKTLLQFRDKLGTEYVLALIPLGGYVKMLDENEGNVPPSDLPFAFNRQPFYKKFLIVLAGPVTNIFCAFVLYWLIFVIGFVAVKPVIGTVKARSIAAEGGLKKNQQIVSIDNKTTSTWTTIIFRLLSHAGNQDHVKIEVGSPADKKTEHYILDLSNWHMDALTPNPLVSVGITPYVPDIPLIIGIISADSPAAISQLKLGDKITALNKNPVKNWDELIIAIMKHPGETMTFAVERQNKVIDIPVALGYQRNWLMQKSGYLGIGPAFQWPKELLQKIKYGPIEAIPHAWQEISDFTYFNLMLVGKIVTGKVSMQSLGGPITIFESAGEALNYGFLAFISFLAFLSITLGIINLLPIPGLDGGHLFIQIIEFIIRRPVPEQIQMILYRFGLLLLLFVIVQALVNDVLRLY